jgi:hypothetical protein
LQDGIDIPAEVKSMVYRGHVENGAIRLDDAPTLPEGAGVEVRLLPEPDPQEKGEKIPTLYERLKDFVGKAEGLPPDMSVNHDHYLYGVPKRQ